ncbi:MAG: IS1/IS1595 family N-terminal zinc-binding domain-containing protein [Sporomusa sp.]
MERCRRCGRSNIVKNGYRNGVPRFKCNDCHYQFVKQK